MFFRFVNKENDRSTTKFIFCDMFRQVYNFILLNYSIKTSYITNEPTVFI